MRALEDLELDAVSGGVGIQTASGSLGATNIWFDFGAMMNAAFDAYCAAIPDARVVGVSGSIGGIAAGTAGGELLYNYHTGEVSAFAHAGGAAGWNGVASADAYIGFVNGFDAPYSNAQYYGGATGFYADVLGAGYIYGSSSNGGLTDAIGTMAPNFDVYSYGLGVSAALTPGGGVTAQAYSQPANLGYALPANAVDQLFYYSQQLCN